VHGDDLLMKRLAPITADAVTSLLLTSCVSAWERNKQDCALWISREISNEQLQTRVGLSSDTDSGAYCRAFKS
jgi:Leucine-rich repeat (LRR) protein